MFVSDTFATEPMSAVPVLLCFPCPRGFTDSPASNLSLSGAPLPRMQHVKEEELHSMSVLSINMAIGVCDNKEPMHTQDMHNNRK